MPRHPPIPPLFPHPPLSPPPRRGLGAATRRCPQHVAAGGEQFLAHGGAHLARIEQPDRHRSEEELLPRRPPTVGAGDDRDRKSTRLNSSHDQISYAVFCLKK